MVSVREAEEIINRVPAPVCTENVPIREAVGCILAEGVKADRDLPPFDRVAMDGYAIYSQAFTRGKSFRIAGVQPAGCEALLLPSPDDCIEVMTGALLPSGTDAVIKYEDGQVVHGFFTPFADVKVSPFMNIHRKGTDARKDEELLAPGIIISPAEVAVLAAVGKPSVQVYRFPKTVLVSTGDELVAVEAQPQPHQIRRSNLVALQAAMKAMYWNAEAVHIKDNYDEVRSSLAQLLRDFEILIISGGVSKGKFDYLPRALEENGVSKLFHQVAQKPGKPFWFGMRNDGRVVFALPGNPVSTYLCFYRYVRPWILRHFSVQLSFPRAVLAEEVTFIPPLTYFLQVQIEVVNGQILARPVAGHGSGDFVNLKNVQGFLELPAHEQVFSAGKAFPFVPFRTVI
jgi:molybdopterin molybdotransferase